MTSSINTNISAYFAQANIATASNNASSSVSRLSSGNRIVKSSDDVAALSTGTSLRTQVTALKTALTNAAQGTSLLQVADGALSQVTEILQRQKAIALQAGSGSLTDTDRGYLNQEFQALSTEIDRLAASANFNGVKLIDGALSQAAKVASSTSAANAASATLGLSANLANGDTLIINGVTLTATSSAPGTAEFAIGATTADTIQNLATKLSSLSSSSASVTVQGGAVTTYAAALGGVNYNINGSNSSTLTIVSRTGGTLGNSFKLEVGSGVTAGKVNIGGQYGGAVLNLLSTDFTSATGAITSGALSQSLNVPFKTGDTIKATIGSSAAVSLYTLQDDDSLTDIVNGINSNSATSGFSAVLVGSGSAYNIELHTRNSSGNIALNGGDNFFATAATGAQTYGLNGATSTINLMSDSLAAAVVAGATGLVAAATATATSPFVDGSNLYVSIAGGAKAALLDAGSELDVADTVATLVAKINNSAAAGALGISAALTGTGNNNIALTYSDSARVGTGTSTAVSITSGLNSTTQNTFNTDALGQTRGSGLNGAYTTFNMFATGFNSPDADIVSANGSGTASAPLEVGTDISITFNSTAILLGTAIELVDGAAIGATDTLQDIAGKINASANAKANGIHARVILDGAGKYNIEMQYAASAVPLVGTGGTATLTGVRMSYDTSTVGGTGSYDPTVTLHGDEASSQYTTYRLFNTAFANTLSPGQVVAAATSTVATPFDSDDTLNIRVAGHAANAQVDLLGAGGFAVGDTLQDIVNRINANTTGGAAHGFSATLDGIGTNILIKYQGTAAVNGRASFDAGAGFFNNTDPTSGVTNFTNGLNNSYSTANLFNTANGVDTTSGVANGGFIVAAGAATANIPFDSTQDLLITGVGAFNISNTTTIQDIVNHVNTDATAQANGVHARLVNTGAFSQVVLYYADESNTGTASAAVTVSNSGQNNTNGGGTATGVTPTYVPVTNILQNVSTLTASTDNGAAGLTNLGRFGLSGGIDNGLGFSSTTVTGTVADNLLTGLSQNKARSLISFPDIDDSALTSTGNFGTAGAVVFTVGGKAFTFVTSAAAVDQILIGDTLKETLDNAVATINRYAAESATGDIAYQLNQMSISRVGNSISVQGKGISNVTTIAGAASAVTLTGFTNGATVSSANLSNSSRNTTGNFGVDVTGISNASFTGTIGGFTATYAGTANTVNLSVKIGDFTYTANNVDTNPTSGDKVIRFLSDDVSGASGGYFDIQLATNRGETVAPASSTADSAKFAQRLNAAFNGLAFAQTRAISSYSGTQSITSGNTLIGSLLGSSVKAKLDSFASNKLTNIEVTAPPAGGGDAKIVLTIDGKQYATTGLGAQLGANQSYRLTNTVDSNQYVDFTTGDSNIDLSTSDYAKVVQTALATAFGVSNGAGALSFQIGSSSSDTLAVSIGNATTSSLFDGQTLDVLSQPNATLASTQLDKALQNVTTLRASVGALQSRFNFASANIQIGIQNQDAARAELLDTDVATESTNYANAQVKLQAGISVLAQANQQLQNLLKLIQ